MKIFGIGMFLVLAQLFSISNVMADGANGNISAPWAARNRKPASAQAAVRTDADDDEVSTGAHIAGGVVGTLFAFGTGQLVQGRYFKTGWIVTLGEGGSLALLVAGINKSSCDTTLNYYGPSTSGCDISPMLWGGLAGLVAFRIYELIDVWAGPAWQNEEVERRRAERRMSLWVAPTSSNSALAGFQWRF